MISYNIWICTILGTVNKHAMYQEIDSLELVELETVLNNPRELYLTLMGKHPEDIPLEIMMQLWDISSRHISNMYKRAISSRYS